MIGGHVTGLAVRHILSKNYVALVIVGPRTASEQHIVRVQIRHKQALWLTVAVGGRVFEVLEMRRQVARHD